MCLRLRRDGKSLEVSQQNLIQRPDAADKKLCWWSLQHADNISSAQFVKTHPKNKQVSRVFSRLIFPSLDWWITGMWEGTSWKKISAFWFLGGPTNDQTSFCGCTEDEKRPWWNTQKIPLLKVQYVRILVQKSPLKSINRMWRNISFYLLY